MSAPVTSPLQLPAFRALLLNTLVMGVTSSFVWFALIFWVYLETRSVVMSGIVGGAYSLTTALFGPAFGTYVDRHRKLRAMRLATRVTALSFAGATAVFLAVPAHELLRLRSPAFWLLVALTLLGSVAGQLRGIALSTCVTLLVPDALRDRANGMVGTVTGIAFAVTSVFSGLVIGMLGMGWALYLSLGLTVVVLVHLSTVRVDEPEPAAKEDGAPAFVDLGAALEVVRSVPGLWLLIALAAFNNLLAGVFMALLDPYGLELVSVETWGLLWGFISLAMIGGGLAVARFGLGPRPLRVLIAVNALNWTVCALFGLRSSIVLLTVAMVVWLGCMPALEAAEQTVLQRAVPFEKQGRVFGFSQLVENAAAPLTAFLMAPLAAAVFMPTMTDGRGADWIGGWFGTGPVRGMALMFCLAGLLGLLGTLLARLSRAYAVLSEESAEDAGPPTLEEPAAARG